MKLHHNELIASLAQKIDEVLKSLVPSGKFGDMSGELILLGAAPSANGFVLAGTASCYGTPVGTPVSI